MNASSHLRVRMLTEGAAMIALAQVLSMWKLYTLPQGGSVTLDMLPIFLFCLRWGLSPGLTTGAAYALLQLITGGYAWTWQAILGDYLLAYTLLGLCGLFRGVPGGAYLGTLTGCAARFLCHFVTGATIWSIYMPDSFFGLTMTSPWLYSLLYNGSYIALDVVVYLLLFALLERTALKKYLTGRDLDAAVASAGK